jgi:hypothetical protein
MYEEERVVCSHIDGEVSRRDGVGGGGLPPLFEVLSSLLNFSSEESVDMRELSSDIVS